MMRPRLVVLDMVGTTVRADAHVSEAFEEAFLRHGLSVSPEQITSVRGRAKPEAIERLVHQLPPEEPEVSAEAVYQTFRQLLLDRYGKGARAIPGATDTLDWLEARGLGVSLTTGLDREIAVAILDRLRWSRHIDVMISGDDVDRGRPAPDLIQAAMRVHGEADPRAVLAVGDTVVDLEAAAAAGAGWTIGVLSGAHSREALEAVAHTALLDSVADLPQWLEGHRR